MKVIFDGRMSMSYMQGYVVAADGSGDFNPSNAFDGQVNGLLGAAEPHSLQWISGTHTGAVGFRLVVADSAPEVGAEWEEVVEASFVPAGRSAVVECMGGVVCEFELPQVPHRVRYSARGLEEGHQSGPVEDDEPVVDHYELVFWPAEPAPDSIVRQTTAAAEYWHNTRDPEKDRAQTIRGRWGDNPPSERLIDVLSARWLVERDRDLAEALAVAQPGVQRALAHWAARRGCEEAGVAELDWVAPALEALRVGRVLPWPFDEPAARIARLDQDQRVRRTLVTLGGHAGIDVQGQALFALVMADSSDPLDAALDALTEGTSVFGDERPDMLLAEARLLLPELTRELLAGSADGQVPDPRTRPVEELEPEFDPAVWRQKLVWGDELPSPRLVAVFARDLVLHDRDLAERIADAMPQVQRAIANWAARRACTSAGLTDRLPEVAAALDCLDAGDPLPVPFDTDQAEGEEWRLLDSEGEAGVVRWSSFLDLGEEALRGPVPAARVRPAPAQTDAIEPVFTIDGRHDVSRDHFALPVIRQAADPDPLRAATHALWTAALSAGDGQRQAVLDEAVGRFLVPPENGSHARGWY